MFRPQSAKTTHTIHSSSREPEQEQFAPVAISRLHTSNTDYAGADTPAEQSERNTQKINGSLEQT